MFESKMLVSNSHVNAKKEMKITAIINAIQDIEGIHIENLGMFSKYINEKNIGVFLTYRQIDIIEKPIFNSELIISTYPYNTSSVSGYRQIYIKDKELNQKVKSVSFGAFVDLITGRTVRLPKEVIKTINDFKEDPTMEVMPRKINIKYVNFIFAKTVLVEKSNIDRYQHLNNAYYVEYASNVIDNIYKYNRIRAEYLKPFVAGDIIHLSTSYINDNAVIVKLTDENEVIHAIIEFTKINLSV